MSRVPRGGAKAAAVVLAVVSGVVDIGFGRELRSEGDSEGKAARPSREGSAAKQDPILLLADACKGIPSGDLPPGLTPAQVLMGTERDPRTGKMLPVTKVQMAEDMGSSGVMLDSKPFSVTLALLPGGGAPGKGDRLIDRIGSAQLWAFWDGKGLHKAVRKWDGSRWKMVSDSAADDLTAVAARGGMSFFWAGLDTGGSSQAFVATSDGCASQRPLG